MRVRNAVRTRITIVLRAVLVSVMATAGIACTTATARDEQRDDRPAVRDAALPTAAAIDAGASDARAMVPTEAGLLCERPEERLELDRACAAERFLPILYFCPRGVDPPSAQCMMVTAP